MAPGYGYPPPPLAPPRRATPGEVHLSAGLLYVTGAVAVVAAVVIGLATGAEDVLAGADVPTDVREAALNAGVSIAVLLAFVGFLSLVVARKLQRGRQWARFLVLVLGGLSLAATVAALASGGQPNALTGLVLPVLHLVLLNLPAARTFFRYGGGSVR